MRTLDRRASVIRDTFIRRYERFTSEQSRSEITKIILFYVKSPVRDERTGKAPKGFITWQNFSPADRVEKSPDYMKYFSPN